MALQHTFPNQPKRGMRHFPFEYLVSQGCLFWLCLAEFLFQRVHKELLKITFYLRIIYKLTIVHTYTFNFNLLLATKSLAIYNKYLECLQIIICTSYLLKMYWHSYLRITFIHHQKVIHIWILLEQLLI